MQKKTILIITKKKYLQTFVKFNFLHTICLFVLFLQTDTKLKMFGSGKEEFRDKEGYDR